VLLQKSQVTQQWGIPLRLKFFAAVIMGTAVTAPACALAATVVESASITSSPVPYDTNFTLAGFNTALGTLQSVEFVLTDNTTASVDVINTTGATQSFTNAFANIPLTVSGPSGTTLSDTISATVPSGSVAGNSQRAFSGSPVTDSVNLTLNSNLSAFKGSSPLSFTASAGTGTYGGQAAGDVFFGGSAVTGGTFDVIYTYASAVPEPASWALLMLGVTGIGAAVRRRKDGLALAAA
jgi:hypothetical protein